MKEELKEIGTWVTNYRGIQKRIDFLNELRQSHLVAIREAMQEAGVDRFEYRGNLIILTIDSVRIISPESRKKQNPRVKIGLQEVAP